jgi:hypothetical protein
MHEPRHRIAVRRAGSAGFAGTGTAAPDGSVIGRFRPRTDPEDPGLIAAIEASLPR